jgi:hypothetical protein
MLTIWQLFPPFSLEEEDDEDEIAEEGTTEKNGKAEEEDNSEPDIILDEFNDLEQTGRKSVNGVDEDMAAGETDQTDEATAAGETDQSDEAAAAEETVQTDEATAARESDQSDEATAAGESDQSDEATAVGESVQSDDATAAGETDQSDEATATKKEKDSEEKMEAENDPVVEAKPRSEVGQNTEDELELKATPREEDFKAEAEMDLEAEATKLEAVEQQEPEVKKEAVSTQQTLVSPETGTDKAGNINEASATNESEVEAMDTDERGLVERKANIPAIETPEVAPSEKVEGVDDGNNATDASVGSADAKDQEDDDSGKSNIEGFSKENASGEESNGFTAAGVATDSSAEMDTSLTLSKDDKVGSMSDQLDYNSASGVGASIST